MQTAAAMMEKTTAAAAVQRTRVQLQRLGEYSSLMATSISRTACGTWTIQGMRRVLQTSMMSRQRSPL
jgi:hypothetical protein